MSEKNFEEYWEQTREKWQSRVVDPFADVPCGPAAYGCAFCRFEHDRAALTERRDTCEFCPVIRVYGVDCDGVAPVHDYYALRGGAATERRSQVAAMVVEELDDKKDELIAAMRELWEEASGSNQD